MSLKNISVITLALVMIFTLCSSVFSPLVSTVSADTATALVTLKSTWKYLDNGTDPSSDDRTAWTKADFNDSSWKSSSGSDAKFGAVAGNLSYFSDGTTIPTILLNQYLSDGKNVPAYFFRTTFELSSLPAEDISLVGTVRYDDAVIIYINGTRVAAFDEPSGGYASNISYGAAVGQGAPATQELILDSSVLKTGTNIVAVELHQANATSSDVYFEMPTLVLGNASQTHLSMHVGSDETKRNFIWRCALEEGSIEYGVRKGSTFPALYKSVDSKSIFTDDTYVHTATIENLAYDTEYVYRVRNGNVVSENYYFKTDKNGDFNFIYVSDPQIGACGNAETDQTNWNKAVNLAKTMFPSTNLLVCTGDQIDWPESPADQFGKFLSPEQLKSMAVSTTVGNHEAYAEKEHIYFNEPNTKLNGVEYGSSAGGCDNWFTYNNVLFININGNNSSAAEHKVFIEAAINANPNTTWRIVLMHQSLFGGTASFVNENIIPLRNSLAPIFEANNIDAVLSGHDHVFVRTFLVENGFTPNTTGGVKNSYTDPEGILYITNSTATGCKYYGLTDIATTPHVAVREQYVPTFSNVEVTSNSFKITTYRVDTNAVLDTVELVKDKKLDENSGSGGSNGGSVEIGDVNLALNKKYSTSEYSPSYPDEGGTTMTDGLIPAASATYSDPTYIGFNINTDEYAANDYFAITVDLEKEYNLGKFIAHVGAEANGAGIMAPKSVFVYVSNNNTDFELVGAVAPTDTTEVSSVPAIVELTKSVKGRYVQFRFKAAKSWVMVAEVEVYEGKGDEPETPPEEPEQPTVQSAFTADITAPNTYKAGDEVVVDITITDVKQPLHYVGFHLNYDNNVFALTNAPVAPSVAVNAFKGYAEWDDLSMLKTNADGTNYVYVRANTAGNGDGSITTVTEDGKLKFSISFTAKTDATKDAKIWIDDATVEGSYADQTVVDYIGKGDNVTIKFNGKTTDGDKPSTDNPSVDKPTPDNPDEDEDKKPVITPDYMLGDVNGNKEIDSMDYILLKRAYFGTFNLSEEASIIADITKNGEIDSMDYILLKRAYFGTYVIK